MTELESAFHVLGLADAHELDLKADIVDRIGALIKERGWTQTQAGERMGMGQAEVSKMLSGQLDRFTVDRLVKALAGLGERVRLTFEPLPEAFAPLPRAAARVAHAAGSKVATRRAPVNAKHGRPAIGEA